MSVVDLSWKRRGCAAFKGGRESPFGMQGDSIFYVHFILIYFIVENAHLSHFETQGDFKFYT